MAYRYKFEQYTGKKHRCPMCEKQTFVLYVDTWNNDRPIHPDVGKCDREEHCGNNLPPWQFFAENPDIEEPQDNRDIYDAYIDRQAPVDYNYIDAKYLLKSCKNPCNAFTNFLLEYTHENYQAVEKLLRMYNIGSFGKAVIYWQVDVENRVRAGKIMWYASNGKRLDYMTWAHKKIKEYQNDFNVNQCLYGEHLLARYPQAKKILIVEAEKTAIILKSVYLDNDNVLVLAAGSLQGLNLSKFACFQNRDCEIYLIPDNGEKAENLWKKKMQEIRNKYRPNIKLFSTSDYISACFYEQIDLEEGQDIADYLIAKKLGQAWIK